MKRVITLALCCFLIGAGCQKPTAPAAGPQATAFGTAIVEVSGGKQVASVGSSPSDPVVVQVNDAQGAAVAGARVNFLGAPGMAFDPPGGVTDSSGQISTVVSLGGAAGRYQFEAVSADKSGKRLEVKLEEIALGYQQGLGQQLNLKYCARCHDPESTPERVSNMDNLDPKPHPFAEGDTLNKLGDADLVAIISHGGPALGKSPQMPPFGYTLSASEIQALISYIRAVSDPPYRTKGLVYAKK